MIAGDLGRLGRNHLGRTPRTGVFRWTYNTMTA